MEHEQEHIKHLQVKRRSIFTQLMSMPGNHPLHVLTDMLPLCLYQTLKFEHYSTEQQRILFDQNAVTDFTLFNPFDC